MWIISSRLRLLGFAGIQHLPKGTKFCIYLPYTVCLVHFSGNRNPHRQQKLSYKSIFIVWWGSLSNNWVSSTSNYCFQHMIKSTTFMFLKRNPYNLNFECGSSTLQKLWPESFTAHSKKKTGLYATQLIIKYKRLPKTSVRTCTVHKKSN